MRRTQIIILVGFGVFMFLAISALVARSLSATGTERSYVLEIAQAQARGDTQAVLAKTPACAAGARLQGGNPGVRSAPQAPRRGPDPPVPAVQQSPAHDRDRHRPGRLAHG